MMKSRLLFVRCALGLLLLPWVTPPCAQGQEALRQTIDAQVKQAWEKHQLTPSAEASDAEFLRRVYLDLTGVVPGSAEAKAFLADPAQDKRAKLIDQLLANPLYGEHQANLWDLVFFGRHPSNGDLVRTRGPFKSWLADQFNKKVPYNQWAQEVLLAEKEGTEYFLAQYRNQPEDATMAVSRVFLGTQIQCARCHDHPFDRWTQKDFYGLAGFLVRVVVQESGTGNTKKISIGEKATGEVLFTGPAKDQVPGKKGEPVAPKFLGGDPLKEPPAPKEAKEKPMEKGPLPKPAFSRKEQLAKWVVAKDNPFFAQAVVNRVWAQYLGRGLVNPVDDFGENNQASLPALLKTMTEQFVAKEYDLQWLTREIVNSKTYQRSARGTNKEAMPKYYERAKVRPLSAEEILRSMRFATAYDSGDPKIKLNNATEEYFLRFFGEPLNGLGEFQGGLSEHLFLNNAENVRQFARRRPGNLADQLVSSKDDWPTKVERLYLAILSRYPSAIEKSKMAELIAKAPKADLGVEDAIWALLNSSEFRFNH